MVESHHDVARMQISVDKVVKKQHAEESVKAFIGNVMLEDAASVLHEVCQWDALGIFFNKDIPRCVLGIRVWEPGCRSIFEVLP